MKELTDIEICNVCGGQQGLNTKAKIINTPVDEYISNYADKVLPMMKKWYENALRSCTEDYAPEENETLDFINDRCLSGCVTKKFLKHLNFMEQVYLN